MYISQIMSNFAAKYEAFCVLLYRNVLTYKAIGGLRSVIEK